MYFAKTREGGGYTSCGATKALKQKATHNTALRSPEAESGCRQSRSALRENDRRRKTIMVRTVVDGTFRLTNLTNESPEYLARREELRLAEIELTRQRERVAEMRRNLPEGAAVQDYQFEEGPGKLDAGDAPARGVRLSELFTRPNRSL